jgi:hypothetical protein
VLLGSLLNLHSAYILRRELHLHLVLEILQYLNCFRFLELHLHLVLEHQITQLFTRIYELDTVLVRQRLATKQRFCILHSELRLQVGQAQRHRKRRAHSLEPFQSMEMALQHQNNCTLFIELEQHQDSLGLLHHLDTEKLEPHMAMVEQLLTTKRLASIPRLVQPMALESVQKVPHHLRLQSEQQAHPVRVQRIQLVCILHHEMQAVLELVILQRRLLQHLLELLLVLVLEIRITQFCTRIYELDTALALRPLVILQSDCILLHALHQVLELVGLAIQPFIVISALQLHPVVRQLEMKRLVYISLLEVQLVLELEQRALMSSRFFTEHLYLPEHQAKQQLEIMLHHEQLLVLVLQRLETPHLDFIQLQELQLEVEQAVPAIQSSKVMFVQQTLLVAQLLVTKRLVCTQRRETQMEMELVHHH